MAEPARKIDDISPAKAPAAPLGISDLVKQSQQTQAKQKNFKPGFKAKIRTTGTFTLSQTNDGAPKTIDAVKSTDQFEDEPEKEINPDREPEEEKEQNEQDQSEETENPDDPNKKVEPEADQEESKKEGDKQKEEDSEKKPKSEEENEQQKEQEDPQQEAAPQNEAGPDYYQGPPENEQNPDQRQAPTGAQNQPESRRAQQFGQQPDQQQGQQPEGQPGEEEQPEPTGPGDGQEDPSKLAKTKKQIEEELAIQSGKTFLNWCYGAMATIAFIPLAMLVLDGYIIVGMFSDNVFWHQMAKWQMFLLALLHFIVFTLLVLMIWAVLNYVCTGFTGFVIKHVLSHLSDTLKFCDELDKAGLLIKF